MENVPISQEFSIQGYVDTFNQYLLSFDYEKMPLGLYRGIMGSAIYLYHQERYFQQSDFGRKASSLIDLIYSKLESESDSSLENGLIGIGLGFNYLIMNNFVEGNINSILSECDDSIFKSLVQLQQSQGAIRLHDALSMLYHIFYFTVRLQSRDLAKHNQFLFQHLICQTINHIENNYFSEKYEEPIVFSPFSYFLPLYITILNRVFKLGFFNAKIERIYEELNDKIISQIPLQESHRYILGNTLILNQIGSTASKWQNHAHILLTHTNVNQIIEEFSNKNLFIYNGYCGFIWLMKLYNSRIERSELLSHKIEETNLWSDFEHASQEKRCQYLGLFTGLEGVIITHQYLAQ